MIATRDLRAATALLLGASLVAAGTSIAREGGGGDPYRDAQELFHRGWYDQAEALLRGALAERPEDDRLRELLVKVLVSAGEVVEAEAELRGTLTRRPDDARTLRILGALLQDQGRQGEGAELLRGAAVLDPGDPETWLELGRGMLRSGDAAGAIPALERARDIDPGAPEIRYSLGQAYGAAGRRAEAEAEFAAYRSAQAAKQERFRQYRTPALVLRSIGEKVQELEANPEASWDAYASLAAMYRRVAALGRGREVFRGLAARRADLAAPRAAEALLAAYQGKKAEAWELLRGAREREPTHAGALAAMTEMADTAGRREEVAGILHSLEEGDRPPPQLPVWLAVLDLGEGRASKAEVPLRAALDHDPKDALALRSLGLLYQRAGRKVEALAALQRLVALEPARGENFQLLAETESQLQLLEPARAHAERAVELGIVETSALNLAADLTARSGEPSRAVELLERSLAMDPDQPGPRALLERLRAALEGPRR